MPKTIIHVNQHKIRANCVHKTSDPVLTCKSHSKACRTNVYAREAIIFGENGKVAARVIYSPDKPLSCGATVWIETQNKVETFL